MNEEVFDIKKELNFALSLIKNNNHSGAIKIYEKILQKNLENFEANSNLGMLYAQNNNLAKAEKHLNEAIKIEPKNPYALNNLASILIRLGKNHESIKYSKNAINLKQDFSLAYNNLGLAQQNLSKFDDAKKNFLKAIDNEKTNVFPYYNLARLYETLDDLKNSELYYLKSIEINSKFFSSYNNIMNLYERTNEDNKLLSIIERSEKIFTNNFSIKLFKGKLQFKSKLYNEAVSNLKSFNFDKNNFSKESIRCNILANSYDGISKFNEAFKYFNLANKINLEINKYKVNKDRYIKIIENRTNYFKNNNFENWKKNNFIDNEKDPIFIIGFPRSGTTLLKTILNSHPNIEVIEEKPIINKFIGVLDKEINSDLSNLKELNKEQLEKMNVLYFDILKNYKKKDKQKIYIDKMPLNIIYVGEIFRIFPNAKFILAIRHPCDCILSSFMQNFLLNDAMANFTDLESTSKFYNQVMILWQQYLKKLKIKYHLVKYEDLVIDFEKSVYNLLNFLNLEWSDNVKKFYESEKNQEKISTPSYNQVNKTIYSKSIGRWKNYKKEFDQVFHIIEPWIKNYNY